MTTIGPAARRRIAGRIRRPAFGLLLVCLAAWSGGCGRDQIDLAARDASIYQIIIADLADQSGITSTGDASTEGLPVVFVDSLGPTPIPLETQVQVVARFVETYEIRFIDDVAEAIEVDSENRPVRVDSVLLGLGPINLERRAEVRGELYVDRDDIRAFRYTLVPDANHAWALADVPEPTEPEGFPPPP